MTEWNIYAKDNKVYCVEQAEVASDVPTMTIKAETAIEAWNLATEILQR